MHFRPNRSQTAASDLAACKGSVIKWYSVRFEHFSLLQQPFVQPFLCFWLVTSSLAHAQSIGPRLNLLLPSLK